MIAPKDRRGLSVQIKLEERVLQSTMRAFGSSPRRVFVTAFVLVLLGQDGVD
jgi:Arc/MetJ family transcription regulator